MKRLPCGMCGSTDLMKRDGVFACQSCGCKHSVEEARKMMAEGTVSVSDPVRTDSSHLISNYFKLANKSYDSDNEAEAEEYCNKIIEIRPYPYCCAIIHILIIKKALNKSGVQANDLFSAPTALKTFEIPPKLFIKACDSEF